MDPNPINKEAAKRLFDGVTQHLDIPDKNFDEFLLTLNDDERRKRFHTAISEHLDIGDYNTFERKMFSLGPTVPEKKKAEGPDPAPEGYVEPTSSVEETPLDSSTEEEPQTLPSDGGAEEKPNIPDDEISSIIDLTEEEAVNQLQPLLAGTGLTVSEYGIGDYIMIEDNLGQREPVKISLQPNWGKEEEVQKLRDVLNNLPADNKSKFISPNKYSDYTNDPVSFVESIAKRYGDIEVVFDPNSAMLQLKKGDNSEVIDLDMSKESFHKINNFVYNNMDESGYDWSDFSEKLKNTTKNVRISEDTIDEAFYSQSYFPELIKFAESNGIPLDETLKERLKSGTKITSDEQFSPMQGGMVGTRVERPYSKEEVEEFKKEFDVELVNKFEAKRRQETVDGLTKKQKDLKIETFLKDQPNRGAYKDIALQGINDELAKENEVLVEGMTSMEQYKDVMMTGFGAVVESLKGKLQAGGELVFIPDAEGVNWVGIKSNAKIPTKADADIIAAANKELRQIQTNASDLINKVSSDLNKSVSNIEEAEQYKSALTKNYSVFDAAVSDFKKTSENFIMDGLNIGLTVSANVKEAVGMDTLAAVDRTTIDDLREEKRELERVEETFTTKLTYEEAMALGRKGEFAFREFATQSPYIIAAIAGSAGAASLQVGTMGTQALIGGMFGVTTAGDKYDRVTTRQETARAAKIKLKELEAMKDQLPKETYTNSKYDLERSIAVNDISDTDKALSVIGTGIIEGTITGFLGTAPNAIKVLKNLKNPNRFVEKMLASNYKATLGAMKEIGLATGREMLEETLIEGLTVLNDNAFLGDQIDFSKLDDVAVTSLITSGAMNVPGTAYSTLITQSSVSKYKTQIKQATDKIAEMKLMLSNEDLTELQRKAIHDNINTLMTSIADHMTSAESDALLMGSDNIKEMMTLGGLRTTLLKKAGVDMTDNYTQANAKVKAYMKGLPKKEALEYKAQLESIDTRRNEIVGELTYENAIEKVFGEKGLEIAEGLNTAGKTAKEVYTEVYKKVREDINEKAQVEFNKTAYVKELNNYRKFKANLSKKLEAGEITEQEFAEANKKLNKNLADVQNNLNMDNKKAGITTRDKKWDDTVKEALPDSGMTEEQLNEKITQGNWGLLTAENPNTEIVTDEDNAALNEEAKAWLESKDYTVVPVFGKYGNSEQSFFVEGLSYEHAVEFANRFNQESVATDTGLVYQDGTFRPRTGERMNVNQSDNYSTINVGGKQVSFAIDYDFNTKNEKLSGLEQLEKQFGPVERTEITMEELDRQIDNAWNALSGVVPNLTIRRESQATLEARFGKELANSRGFFVKDGDEHTIYINEEQANKRTVAHEAFHAVLISRGYTDATLRKITDKMLKQMKRAVDPALAKRLDEWGSKYQESIASEEAMAELLGIMAEENMTLPTKARSIIRQWIDAIIEALGLSKGLSIDNISDFMNNLSAAVIDGDAVKGIIAVKNNLMVWEDQAGIEFDKDNRVDPRKQLSESESTSIQKEVEGKVVPGKAVDTWIKTGKKNKKPIIVFEGEINQANLKNVSPQTYHGTAAKLAKYNTFKTGFKQRVESAIEAASRPEKTKALNAFNEVAKKKMESVEKLIKKSPKDDMLKETKSILSKIAKTRNLNTMYELMESIPSQVHYDAFFKETFFSVSEKGLKKLTTAQKTSLAAEIYNKAKEVVKSNLRVVYESVDPTIRHISKLWYDGANLIAQDMSTKYGVSLEQASGIIASQSPQMPWFDNLHLADALMDIMANMPDTAFTQEQLDFYKEKAKGYKEQVKYIPSVEKLVGKKLKDLSDYDAAIFVRTYYDMNIDRRAPIRIPTGTFVGEVQDGASSFGGYSTIEKAVSIFRDGSTKNISNNIGAMNKVRNFYMNIADPTDSRAVTIDTHAMAIALFKPLASGDYEVDFGEGSFAFYADAYRELAQELGIKARELQSITWEAARAFFPAKKKASPGYKDVVSAIWDKYDNGEISLDEVHNQIKKQADNPNITEWSVYLKTLQDEKARQNVGGRVVRRQRTDASDNMGAGARDNGGVPGDTGRGSISSSEAANTTNRAADTQDFFSDVVEGRNEKYRPSKPYEYEKKFNASQESFRETYDSFKGNFDEHIATSIPTFRDTQVQKGAAIAGMYNEGLVYDIGGSEGGFVKAITAESNGKVRSINLDPNPDMKKAHEAKPVKGSEFVAEAFYEGFDNYKAHEPKEKADVVHESMVFQFITPDRKNYIGEVKDKYLKDDGLFITEEKLQSKDPQEYAENERIKNTTHKNKYYTPEQIAMKGEEVLVGMQENQAYFDEYMEMLKESFDHVEVYWESGNFKGIVASDNKQAVDTFKSKLGSTSNNYTVRQQKSGNTIQEVKKFARDNNISASDTLTFLKLKGFTQEQINEDGRKEAMQDAQSKFITSRKRGNTMEMARDAATEDLKKSQWYSLADDMAREEAVREIVKNTAGKIKRAPTPKRVLGKNKQNKIVVEEYAALKDQIKLEARAAREAKQDVNAKRKALAGAVKGLVQKGKLTTNQAKVIINKLSSLNMDNEAAVDRFIEYMDKVYSDANFAERLLRSNKKRKKAKKNIKSKIGSALGTFESLNRLFSIDAKMIPLKVLDKYSDIINEFADHKAVLSTRDFDSVLRDVEEIFEVIDQEINQIPNLQLMYESLSDDQLSFGENIATMLEQDLISEKDADLMKKYKKDILPPKESEQAEDTIPEIEIKMNNVESESEAAAANRFIELVSRASDDVLMGLSQAQRNNIQLVLNNIEAGYFSHYGLNLANEIEAIMAKNEVMPYIAKKPSFTIDGLIGKIKHMFQKGKMDIEYMIRQNPLYDIDTVLGNHNSKVIYDNTFGKAGKAYAKMDAEITKVTEKLLEAEKLLETQHKNNPNKITDAKFRIMLYMLQREFESNPGSKSVFSAYDAAKAVVDKYRSAKQYTEKEANALEAIIREYDLSSEGSLDRLFNSLSVKEKRAMKLIDQVNNSLSEKVLHTASVIRGSRPQMISNYVHHSVSARGSEEINSINTKYNNFRSFSTKAGTTVERTSGVKPLNLDPITATMSGARETLMDYHMTVPIKTVFKTINKIKTEIDQNPDSTKHQKDIAESLVETFEDATRITFMRDFSSDDIKMFNQLKALGYKALLASLPRAFAELSSNLGYALIANPQAMTLGMTKYGKYAFSHDSRDIMINLSSEQTGKLFDKKISGKIYDVGLAPAEGNFEGAQVRNDIHNKAVQVKKYLIGKPYTAINTVADKLISTPDKAISRPMWFGSLSSKFKSITGREIDFERIKSNDTAYMLEFESALDEATKYADNEVTRAATSVNPFNSIIKNKIEPGKTKNILLRQANGFMTNFIIYEYTTARAAMYALMKNGDISRPKAARLLGATTLRMSSYYLLYQFFISIFDGLVSSALGLGLEDEEIDYKELFMRQLAGSGLQLFLGRNLGNFARAPVSLAVDYVNEEYLEVLRGGRPEYDPYAHGLFYSPVSRENIKKEKFWESLGVLLSGPYSPLLKTFVRGGKAANRAINRKKQSTRDQYIEELQTKTVLEILGNLGMVPLYKDTKRILDKKRWQNTGGGKKKKKKYKAITGKKRKKKLGEIKSGL